MARTAVQTEQVDAKTGERLVEVFIPKTDRNDTQQFVSVNGENILIQKGVSVKIPLRYAQVLENAEAMHELAQMYMDSNVRE